MCNIEFVCVLYFHSYIPSPLDASVSGLAAKPVDSTNKLAKVELATTKEAEMIRHLTECYDRVAIEERTTPRVVTKLI